MTTKRRAITAFSSLALTGAVGLTACSPAGGGDSCFGKCDGLGDGVHEVLAERSDPIARYLRESQIDDEGFIDATFSDILFGVAEVQGCDQSSIKTFVVSDDLITSEPFPRLVSAVCTEDAAKASEFFIAASFPDPDVPGEVDLQSIEMFAWDSNRRGYTFYETFPAESGGVRLDPSPQQCRQCHLTSSDTAPTAMHMTPIMNELTRPWTHWNAEPGFPSFDFHVPEEALASDSFAELVEPFKGQADQLETIIRAGHDKVALARLRERRDSVDVDKAMALLRPVFCSEQVNYASEDFTSGVIMSAAALDPGIQQAYLQIRPDNWEWDWVNDTTMRLPAPSGAVLEQVPVRGNSDVAVENLLMSTRVLSPMQILRVRSLDWKRPVFSDFRCGLWREARNKLQFETPDFGDATRVSHIIPIMFEEIMMLGPHPLQDGSESVISLPLADTEPIADLFNALSSGEVGSDCSRGFCSLTVDELGNELDTFYRTLLSAEGRAELFAGRDSRICHLLTQVEVEEPDDRFESPRECAEKICAEKGQGEDIFCITELAEAARDFDTSTDDKERATFCANPVRFQNRPSLPDVADCPEPNRWRP